MSALLRCVHARPGYVLTVGFDGGITGSVCLKHRLTGPLFGPLSDPEYFALAQISPVGTVCWPNGAELCTVRLYEKILYNILTNTDIGNYE